MDLQDQFIDMLNQFTVINQDIGRITVMADHADPAEHVLMLDHLEGLSSMGQTIRKHMLDYIVEAG